MNGLVFSGTYWTDSSLYHALQKCLLSDWTKLSFNVEFEAPTRRTGLEIKNLKFGSSEDGYRSKNSTEMCVSPRWPNEYIKINKGPKNKKTKNHKTETSIGPKSCLKRDFKNNLMKLMNSRFLKTYTVWTQAVPKCYGCTG